MSPLRGRRLARVLPLWLWAALAVLALWWFYVRLARRGEPAPDSDLDLGPPGAAQRPDEATPPPAAVQPEPPAASAPADDLTLLDGIGPATARRLHAAGIHTFVQLAAADEAHLRGLVQGVGLGLADPSTWPQQAQLAAQADWGGLAAFIERQRAARRR